MTRHRGSSNHASTPCVICGERRGGRPVASLAPATLPFLPAKDGQLDVAGVVCAPCLTAARVRRAHADLERERGELSAVEREIAERATTHAAIADEVEGGGARGLGQRAADRVARIGGSWPFVLGFGGFLVAWCAVNAALLTRPFDPYPFILLNLVLSSLAALQAPIIMMSQSRMAEIDRARAAQDFRVNLKAELEVAALHEKMDHLLHQQWDRLVELQDVQLEILEQLRRER